MNYAKSIEGLIGNTPLIELRSASNSNNSLILGKCEFMNPTSSVKDRIAMNMIDGAIRDGKIRNDTLIIEPTSGNTGIGLAAICASRGLRLILTMPASMSIERRKLLAALGAELVLTAPDAGMKGAVEKAIELSEKNYNSILLQQFENPHNKEIHYKTTAEEIWRDTDGTIDIFIAAVGTGGTLSGVGEFLKEKNPNIKIVAVEPYESPILSGGSAAPHKIQGIGAGFVPKVLNTSLYTEVIKVKAEEAFAASRDAAKYDGLLVGISAGANIHAAKILANRKENSGKRIVTILCDTGERYLSTDLYG